MSKFQQPLENLATRCFQRFVISCIVKLGEWSSLKETIHRCQKASDNFTKKRSCCNWRSDKAFRRWFYALLIFSWTPRHWLNEITYTCSSLNSVSDKVNTRFNDTQVKTFASIKFYCSTEYFSLGLKLSTLRMAKTFRDKLAGMGVNDPNFTRLGAFGVFALLPWMNIYTRQNAG